MQRCPSDCVRGCCHRRDYGHEHVRGIRKYRKYSQEGPARKQRAIDRDERQEAPMHAEKNTRFALTRASVQERNPYLNRLRENEKGNK